MPPREKELGHAMQEPSPQYARQNQTHNKVSGSLSDGSVCDYPPLSKSTLRQHELQIQNNVRQEYMIPPCKQPLSRKRHTSSGDREHTGSSGYETGSKKMKHSYPEIPTAKPCDPVMENSISSTNDKFAGGALPKVSNVRYTLQDRVMLAAFAIAYNNCKAAAMRFGSLSKKKPPPDFQTIYALRQKLLSSGCLVESHVAQKRAPPSVSSVNLVEPKPILKHTPAKKLLPNPDEIRIDSDSDDECDRELSHPRHRSVSVETLLIDGVEKLRPRSVSGEDNRSRSHSQSGQRHLRSRSSDSSDSSSDSSSELNNSNKSSKAIPYKNKKIITVSDSDSKSCDSDETDFLSRHYRKKRKSRPKTRNKSPEKPKDQTCENRDIMPPPASIKGYSTARQDVSPLVTGNIYSTKLPNMVAKPRIFKTKPAVETDGYGSEYVPTRVGTVTKNNYQAFKQNVMKKGYWAKGNGNRSIGNKIQIISDKIIKPVSVTKTAMSLPAPKQTSSQVFQQVSESVASMPTQSIPPAVIQQQTHMYPQSTQIHGYATAAVSGLNKIPTDFPTNRDVATSNRHESVNLASKTRHDTSARPPDKIPVKVQECVPKSVATPPENTARVFDIAQSNSGTKNKSILDIFGNEDQNDDTSEKHHNGDSVRKSYELNWDEDDDALYKTDDPAEVTMSINYQTQTPAETPPVNLFESTPLAKTRITIDTIRERRDQLLGVRDKAAEQLNYEQLYTSLSQIKPTASQNKNIGNVEHHRNLTMHTPPAIPQNISNEIIGLSHLHCSSREVSQNTTPTKHTWPMCEDNTSLNSRPPSNCQGQSTPTDYPSQRNKAKSSPIHSVSPMYGVPSNPTNQTSPMYPKKSNPIEPFFPPTPTKRSSQNREVEPTSNNRSTPTYEVQLNPKGQISPDNPIKSNANPHATPPYGSFFPPTPTKRSSQNYEVELNSHNHSTPTCEVQANMKKYSSPTYEIPSTPTKYTSDNLDTESNSNNLSTPTCEVQAILRNNSSPTYELQFNTKNASPPSLEMNNTSNHVQMPTYEVDSTPEHSPKTGIATGTNETVEAIQETQPIASQGPQLDLSNFLTGINTNTLLLALQNLQQLAQNTSTNPSNQQDKVNNQESANTEVETINLTNDEEWEKESNEEESIEKQLERMDGNTGDTPFLSDILDPGPVVMPNNVKKFNINLKKPEETETTSNENVPVIGNFKSFALPKPVLLEKRKVPIPPKRQNNKKMKKLLKKKVCILSYANKA